MTELKPCPFCGGEAELRDFGEKRNPYIFCDGPCSFVMDGDTVEEAIEAWNTRAERTCSLEKVHDWDDEWEPFGYVCKSCEEALPSCYGSDSFGNVTTPNFCPNCGARVVE